MAFPSLPVNGQTYTTGGVTYVYNSTKGVWAIQTYDTVDAAGALTSIKTVDGAGSGLDADTLDGLTSSQFTVSGTTSTQNITVVDPSGTNRTTPIDLLSLTADNNNSPYYGFGGRLVFKNRRYASDVYDTAAYISAIKNDLSTSTEGSDLKFSTGANTGDAMVDRMTIKSTGQVGIGKIPLTSGSTLLDVYGSINMRDGYNLTWGGDYASGWPTIFASNTGQYIEIAQQGASSTIRLRAESGKVKITKSNAGLDFDAGLWIQSNPSDGTAGRGGGITFQNLDVNTAGIYAIREEQNWKGALTFYTHENASGNTFGTTFTEKMRINANGHITTPSQPAFHACGNAGMAASSTAQRVVWPTVLYNTGNGYNASTGQFTAPVSGKYLFGWTTIGNNSNSVWRHWLYKNGVRQGDIHLRQDTNASGSEYATNGMYTIPYYLNAGDTMSVWAANDSGIGWYGSGSTTNDYYRFWGYLIG